MMSAMTRDISQGYSQILLNIIQDVEPLTALFTHVECHETLYGSCKKIRTAALLVTRPAPHATLAEGTAMVATANEARIRMFLNDIVRVCAS